MYLIDLLVTLSSIRIILHDGKIIEVVYPRSLYTSIIYVIRGDSDQGQDFDSQQGVFGKGTGSNTKIIALLQKSLTLHANTTQLHGKPGILNQSLPKTFLPASPTLTNSSTFTSDCEPFDQAPFAREDPPTGGGSFYTCVCQMLIKVTY